MSELKNISGIVVCGGQSNRMGSDKSLLNYYGQPQWQYMREMLSGLCTGVYLSINAQQAQSLPPALHLLEDLKAYRETGPMAALLTAADKLPGSDFLLTGCDYPFLQEEELARFLQFARTEQTAAAFYNEKEKLYEPLLAYYPQEAAVAALNLFKAGNYSLQALLRQIHARKYSPLYAYSISSVDTPEQYLEALKITNRSAGFRKED